MLKSSTKSHWLLAQTGNSPRLSVPIEAISGASVVFNLSTTPGLGIHWESMSILQEFQAVG